MIYALALMNYHYDDFVNIQFKFISSHPFIVSFSSVPAIYSEDVEYPVHLDPASKSQENRRGPLPERPGSDPAAPEHGTTTGPDIIQNIPKVLFFLMVLFHEVYNTNET